MNKIRYICNDRNMAVEAEDLPGIRRTKVTVIVYNKPAWEIYFRSSLDQDTETAKLLDKKTAVACRKLTSMTEKAVEDTTEANKVMIALYARTHLKEVRTKLGNTIWQKS